MATLKFVIYPAKVLKDGRHKVRICVSHRQENRYIITNVIIDSEKQFKNGQIVGRPDAGMLNKKLRIVINEYQDALDKIDPTNYTCAQLKDFLSKSTKVKALTISQAADQHINKIKKESTKAIYTRTKNYFIKAVGDVPLEMIDSSMVERFDAYLRDVRKNGSTSRAIHLRHLRSFINPQIKYGNVDYKAAPFVDVIIPESQERELDITVEEFKMIRDAVFTEKPLRMARDLFCLSYYLGGINLIDLLDIDFKNFFLAGTLKNKSQTSIIVPLFTPHSVTLDCLPPSIEIS